MVLETYMKLCVTEPDALEKTLLPQELGNWANDGPKIRFFEYIEKFGH